MADRQSFTLAITCPGCEQAGNVVWEEDARRTMGPRTARVLVAVSQGFHREDGRTPSGDPVIVCDSCDFIQPD